MDISISQQHCKHIEQKIESGKYDTADAVIARALELLDEHDDVLEQELNELRSKVHEGIEQADNGQLTPAGEVFDRLLKRNAKRTPE